MIYCLHPTCEDLRPHVHLFLAEQCKTRKLHYQCQGYVTTRVSTVLTEELIIRKHRRQLTDADPQDYHQLAEQQRQEWERFVKARDDKIPLRDLHRLKASRVWTCTCECHEENRRSPLLAGAFIHRIKPWHLHQDQEHQ